MRYVTIIVLTCFTSVSPAIASMELSDKHECTDCHRLEIKAGQDRKKKEGPTYKEIAKEYKGKKGAEKQLLDSIRKGSKNVWAKKLGKKTEMEAEEDIPVKDAEALVKWILTL